jgi:hypothetical protein
MLYVSEHWAELISASLVMSVAQVRDIHETEEMELMRYV